MTRPLVEAVWWCSRRGKVTGGPHTPGPGCFGGGGLRLKEHTHCGTRFLVNPSCPLPALLRAMNKDFVDYLAAIWDKGRTDDSV
jgi:hypothetical protein